MVPRPIGYSYPLLPLLIDLKPLVHHMHLIVLKPLVHYMHPPCTTCTPTRKRIKREKKSQKTSKTLRKSYSG